MDLIWALWLLGFSSKTQIQEFHGHNKAVLSSDFKKPDNSTTQQNYKTVVAQGHPDKQNVNKFYIGARVTLRTNNQEYYGKEAVVISASQDLEDRIQVGLFHDNMYIVIHVLRDRTEPIDFHANQYQDAMSFLNEWNPNETDEQKDKRKEREKKRKREEDLREEEDAKRKEEDAKRKEEDAKRKEREKKRKRDEDDRDEKDAKRKDEEARRQEEAKRKAEEAEKKRKLNQDNNIRLLRVGFGSDCFVSFIDENLGLFTNHFKNSSSKVSRWSELVKMKRNNDGPVCIGPFGAQKSDKSSGTGLRVSIPDPKQQMPDIAVQPPEVSIDDWMTYKMLTLDFNNGEWKVTANGCGAAIKFEFNNTRTETMIKDGESYTLNFLQLNNNNSLKGKFTIKAPFCTEDQKFSSKECVTMFVTRAEVSNV